MKYLIHFSKLSIWLFGIVLACSGALRADPYIPTFQELAPGVWAGVRDDNPRFPVMGTATFAVSDAGVVVFDGGGSALLAERIIAKIRSLTDKPVTHVIISHWHGDHNFGIYRYLEEFENVQVVAHTFTQAVFDGSRIRYIDDYPTQVPNLTKQIETALTEGKQLNGEPLEDFMRPYYQRILDDADIVHEDFNRVRVTPATITFDDALTIRSGQRTIKVLYLGDGNTAGDIVMWLPDEKIVATGDIVVEPVQYAFNMPPKKWGQTLRNINALDYRILVPGHGNIQTSTGYVDLLIEVADSAVSQREKLIAEGVEEADAVKRMDFSRFKERFIGNDPYLAVYYKAWFADPLAAAAFKELKGIPMVEPNS